jgi:hypothetical protein
VIRLPPGPIGDLGEDRTSQATLGSLRSFHSVILLSLILETAARAESE